MKVIALFLLFVIPLSGMANNAQMKATLVQVINQLHALKPELRRAAQQQDKNPRIKVHFTAWTDSTGHHHTGAIDDINAIESALITTVNRQAVEPRVVKPLNTDFTH